MLGFFVSKPEIAKMTPQIFYSLFEISNNTAFQTSLKINLLKYYKTDIFQYLKPQMGGFIDEESVGISILSSEKSQDKSIQLKCSIFYIERIGGCNCNDEPHAENGYCEMKFVLNEAGVNEI